MKGVQTQLTQHESHNEAVTVQHSIQTTKADLLVLLGKEDPIWSKRFVNFVANVETLAFKHGFVWGAIFCAVVCTILLVVSR